VFDDGIIKGKLGKPSRCPRCLRTAHLVLIEEVNLPDGITWEATILNHKLYSDPLWALGIECGDYARFHRQIVHIREKMNYAALIRATE
jgi:hypothetical protein